MDILKKINLEIGKESDLQSNLIYQKIKETQLIRNDGKGILLVRRGMHWKRIDRQMEIIEVKKLFSNETQPYLSQRIIGEVINRIRSSPEFRGEFPPQVPSLINLLNGVYNLYEKKLYPRISEYGFLYFLNFKYIENAKLEDAKYFMRFLETSLGGHENPDIITFLMEILGYIVSDLSKAKKAFFFIGEPNSGKSLLLKLLQHVVGEDFSTNVDFTELGGKFNVAELESSRVNFCSEISTSKIRKADIFKKIVGGDIVNAERKGENPFKFKILTKLINAGNVLPRFSNSDGTDSITNRMLILRFKKSIPQEDWIIDLEERLIEEADIIFSIAIDSLKNLVSRNYIFAEPRDSMEYKEDYKKSLAAFDEFLRYECVIDEMAKIHKATLWRVFNKFCGENCYENLIDKFQFSTKIKGIRGIEEKRFRINGSNPRAGFLGIGLRRMYDIDQDS